MRDYINIVSGIFESRGLGARRTGEEFVSRSDPNEKIYVNSVTFYPQGATEYPSYEEMVDDLKNIVTNIPNSDVDLIGSFKNSDRAFGIAIFDRPENTSLVFVKPYKRVNLDKTQNQWDNQTGIPGYRYNSKSAAKTQAGLTPQDILMSKQSDLTKQDIINQIAEKFGTGNSLVTLASAIAAGRKLPITIPAPQGMSFTAFRDYFCELLHPIALQTGVYTGNAADAAAKFLGKNGFSKTSINFGTDKTEGLSDSVLIGSDGKKIKVSSKGAKGAQASAKNLLDAVKELEESGDQLSKKYKDVIDLIKEIVQAGQAGAPLLLGVKYGIINPTDANDIQNFKKLPPTSITAASKMKLSPKLKGLIEKRNTDDPNNLNLYFHALAAVAHEVAKKINEDTNFSQAASEILNNGALIQVYTSASEKGNDWVLEKFSTVWPSTSVTGVVFSASKTYYSTGIKGNFTFKILQNGAKAKDDEVDSIRSMPSKLEQPTEPETHKVKGLSAREQGKTDKSDRKSTRARR